MRREEAAALVLALRAAFATPAWDKASIDLYETKLAGLKDAELAREAVEHLIDTERFRPTIAAVLDEYITLSRRRREERSQTHGLDEPAVSEEQRQMNLARLREMYSKVGWRGI